MRQRQAQAILAGLRQNRREAVGGEIVELINKQVEVAAARLRYVGAGHGSKLELRREQ